MTETTSFARWLERELAARRINRSQLAAYMGRRAQTVSAWFNDGRLPSTEVCADLARVLHVPLEEVLRQAGHLPPAPEYPPPEPHIIPEALRLLREMSDEEQRAFALPALELAEALLKRARGGAGRAEQFPPPPRHPRRRRPHVRLRARPRRPLRAMTRWLWRLFDGNRAPDREPWRPPVRHPRHRHDETTMRVSEDGEAVQCQVCGSWHFTDPERQARLDGGEW